MGSGQSRPPGEANDVTRIGRVDDHVEQMFKRPIEEPGGGMTRSSTNLSLIDATVADNPTDKSPRRGSNRRSSAFGTEEVKAVEEPADGTEVVAFRHEDTSDSIKIGKKEAKRNTPMAKENKQRTNFSEKEDIDFEVIDEGKLIEDDTFVTDDDTLRRHSVVEHEDTIESIDLGVLPDLTTKRKSVDRSDNAASRALKVVSESQSTQNDVPVPSSKERERSAVDRRQSTVHESRRGSTTSSNKRKGILKKKQSYNGSSLNQAPQRTDMPKGPEHGEKAFNDTKMPYADGFGGAAVVIRASNQAGEPGRVVDPNNQQRVKGRLYDLFHEKEFKLVHPTTSTEQDTDTGEVFLRLGYIGKAKLWAKLKHKEFKVRELETYVHFRESRTGEGITYTVRFPKVGAYRLEINIIDGAKNSLRRIVDFIIHCTAVPAEIRQFPVTSGTIVMFPTVALMSPTHREIQRNKKVNFKILVKNAKQVNVVTIPSHKFLPLKRSKVEDFIFEGTFIFEDEKDTQVHLMGSLKQNEHSPLYEYLLIKLGKPRRTNLALENKLGNAGKLTPIKEMDEDMRSRTTLFEMPLQSVGEETAAPFIEGFK